MSFDLYCPYCDEAVKPLEDSYEPNVNFERECPGCEKTFVYSIEYVPTYDSYKADCLNGGAHDYQQINGFPKEYFQGQVRCSDCGHETRLPA